MMGRLQVQPAHILPKDKKFEVRCVQGHISPSPAIGCSLIKPMSELAFRAGPAVRIKNANLLFSHTFNAAHNQPT